MPNIQQHLFILTSNHQIRKGLLLIPELPGNLGDDAYEWMMVARNTALYIWNPPMLLYSSRVRRILPPEHNTAAHGTGLCNTLGGLLNTPYCQCSSTAERCSEKQVAFKASGEHPDNLLLAHIH